MELFEYIKSQLPQMPNVAIMKDLGASDELVEYVKESPENTNLNVMGSITSSGGGDAEVWLVGDTGESGMFTLSNVGDIDRMAELFTNGENYQVFANSEALPYYTAPTMEGGGAVWKDNATEEASTIVLGIEQLENDEYSAVLYYLDASTAPTSVEVSVKAK